MAGTESIMQGLPSNGRSGVLVEVIFVLLMQGCFVGIVVSLLLLCGFS